jgi:cell division protein FtsX
MGKILKDLLLAMINATLILVALCLFLAWKLSAATGAIVDSFTDSLQIVHPLQQEVAGTREELQGLRADVVALAESATGVDRAVLVRVEQRLGALNEKVETVQTEIATLRETPRRLLDQSLEAGSGQLLGFVKDVRACRAAQADNPDG